MNPINETYDDYKVAFFTNTYFPFVGGVSRSVDLYRRYLAHFNPQTHIYAPEYDAPHDHGDDIRRLSAITHFNNTDFSLPLPIAFKPMFDFHAQRNRWGRQAYLKGGIQGRQTRRSPLRRIRVERRP